jgi:hypothetical protein
MQEAVITVEREADDEKRRHLFAPGNKGKPKGATNRVTRTIREAVLEAVQPGACHPDGLTGWLIDRAKGGIEDKKIFGAMVGRALPIEVTGEGGGPVKIDLGWLTGRKIGGEVIDITPTTQTLGDKAAARLPTDFQSEEPLSPAGVTVEQGSAEPAKTKRSKGKA